MEKVCLQELEVKIENCISRLETLINTESIQRTDTLLVTMECTIAIKNMLQLIKLTTHGILDVVGEMVAAKEDGRYGRN